MLTPPLIFAPGHFSFIIFIASIKFIAKFLCSSIPVEIAKIFGYDQYKKALNEIKLNYSATKEGKNAEIIINEVLPLVEDKSFKKIHKGETFKLVYEFLDTSDDKIQNKILEIIIVEYRIVNRNLIKLFVKLSLTMLLLEG